MSGSGNNLTEGVQNPVWYAYIVYAVEPCMSVTVGDTVLTETLEDCVIRYGLPCSGC